MSLTDTLQALGQRSGPAVLATVIESTGSAPRQAGAHMLVFLDGATAGTIGGGSVEKRIIEESVALLRDSGTRLFRFDLEQDLGMACGGSMTFFLEVIQPKQKMILFGAGHIGQALVPLARMLDFHITIVDNRPEFANKKRMPQADQIITKAYPEAFKDLQPDQHSFAVIVTHRHMYDQEVLEYCVRKPFAYIGMIGSRQKVAAVLSRLAEAGVKQEVLEKIHTPIGLDLGGQTPQEIAIAIAAEWIAVQHAKSYVSFMTLAPTAATP